MHGGEAQPLRGTERMTAFRLARADLAEQAADVAEQSATRYERNAARGDRGRRLASPDGSERLPLSNARTLLY